MRVVQQRWSVTIAKYRDLLTATLVNIGHDLRPRSLFAFAVIRSVNVSPR